MKRLPIIFMLLAVTAAAFAQSSIKVQVPNVVAVDEQFNISFVIEGESAPSDFSWFQGDDFQLVWGPQKGTSTSISIVNGKRTRSSQHTYTYILIPRKAGTFTVPTATATVKGEKIESSRTTIEVVSDGASSGSSGGSSSGSSAQGGSSSRQSTTGEIARDDLFLRLSLSRSNVVVGEPVTATLKLYQRVNIAGFEDAKFPTFNGFWSQEVLTPTNIEFKRESLGDLIYNTAVLRSWVLIPQQAGDITIDPAELVCLVNVRAPSSSSNSIFDSFFQDDYRTIRKRVTSESHKVRVSKLPAGAPASFGGGVGSFTIKTSLSKDSLRTHDAGSLLVTISGKGNVSLLEAPKINFPPDFEVYDVKVTDNTDKSSGRTSGSKTFEYPFIPRSHGSFTLDPVEYSYYDIDAQRYVTLHGDPVTLKVARGGDADAPQGGVQMVQGTVRRDVKSLGSDIRFISTKEPSLSKQGSFFVFSGAFWGLLAALFAAAAAAYALLRRRAARRSDVVGARGRAATKMAQKRLAVARGYLSNNLYTAFYEELHKALLGFISDKLNIDSADMTKENIASSLSEGGVPEALVSEFTGLLDACEYARYAPDAGHDAMNAHYETAVNVISMIDSSMKKKNTTARSAAVTAVLLMLLPVWSLGAQAPADSLWDAGAAAYGDGDWLGAAEAWTAIEASGLESPELYYNIGNAFFKASDYAHAILYYERALKLDPSYSDARFNLEFARESVQDRIETVPEFFLKTWVRRMGYWFSSNTWTALFFVLLALALAGGLLFLLGSGAALRRTGFFAGLAALLLSFCCLGFAASQKAAYARADSAVITVPVSSVKSSPGAGSGTDLFVLHEGTKVRILDQVGDWLNIELSDGRQGWLPASSLELI